MEIQKFIENFADLFVDTDVSVFNADTKFKELEEWSSLIGLALIAMVDEQYETKMKGEDIRNAQTVEDLFNIVKSRMA